MGPGGAGHQGEKLPAKLTDRDAMTRATWLSLAVKGHLTLAAFFFPPCRPAKMLIAAVTIRFIGLRYEIKKSGIHLRRGKREGGGEIRCELEDTTMECYMQRQVQPPQTSLYKHSEKQ